MGSSNKIQDKRWLDFGHRESSRVHLFSEERRLVINFPSPFLDFYCSLIVVFHM